MSPPQMGIGREKASKEVVYRGALRLAFDRKAILSSLGIGA